MPRCVVRWRRNPHIERCSPSIFHGYSEVAALGHASFNLARSTRAVKTPNPRRPIAFPCCRRLLYVYSKSFPVFSFSLSRVRLSIPPPFRATLSSLPPPRLPAPSPATKYRARRSWISGAGVSAARNCRGAPRNKIARAAANITRRNPRSFVRAFHFVRPSATKSDVYRTPAYARFRLISIVIRLLLVMN